VRIGSALRADQGPANAKATSPTGARSRNQARPRWARPSGPHTPRAIRSEAIAPTAAQGHRETYSATAARPSPQTPLPTAARVAQSGTAAAKARTPTTASAGSAR